MRTGSQLGEVFRLLNSTAVQPTLTVPNLIRHERSSLILYFRTALQLGWANTLRAIAYRSMKRAGIYERLLPSSVTCVPLQLRHAAVTEERKGIPSPELLMEADELLDGKARFFSVHLFDVGKPPNWFLNPFQKQQHPEIASHWSRIADFSAESGDIKAIWEISRFSWATVLARAYRATLNPSYVVTLTEWIEDWWLRNPPFVGPNWMCGQEASIRLINCLLALRLLHQVDDAGMTPFVYAHCRRIQTTTIYAIAQDNNHAISEAVALFIGGTWLENYAGPETKKAGVTYASKGRRLLERAVNRLVTRDGSFSQHSLTYHRLVLDTLSLAELWRQSFNKPGFSPVFYERVKAATQWLGSMINSTSGDGPNLGANDGAHPFRLDTSSYRDFRPCLQLASSIFLKTRALGPGSWDEACEWLGVPLAPAEKVFPAIKQSRIYPDGGYVRIADPKGLCTLLRTPTTRFRPGHADALHLDVWWQGKNVALDSGTYSYADDNVGPELASVVSHNTVQFDGHDQMPRLARFLYGDWVKVSGDSSIRVTPEEQSWTGCCTDSWGATHERTLAVKAKEISVVDRVSGFAARAVLRWRLAPGEWSRTERGCSSSVASISIESSVPIIDMRIEQGFTSKHYLEKTEIPVLTVEIASSPAVLTTRMTFN